MNSDEPRRTNILMPNDEPQATLAPGDGQEASRCACRLGTWMHWGWGSGIAAGVFPRAIHHLCTLPLPLFAFLPFGKLCGGGTAPQELCPSTQS